MSELVISNVTFAPARAGDIGRGLLGFVGFQVGAHLELDGIALRRTNAGAFSLSFPMRKSANGRRRRLVRVITEDARAAIQAQVVGILRARGSIR